MDRATAGLGPDETYTLDGWGTVGDCTLPTGTSGLALNVTAVSPTAATFLRLWPADGAQPTTSNLNPTPGQPPTPNAVNVGLSATGQFSIFNRFGIVNVIIDVVGVYDDHNHDDRYYTEDEADAAFLAQSQDSEAAIDGADDTTIIGTADEVVATVTVDTPTSGYVIVNSSNYVYAFGGPVTARCGISTDSTIGSYLQIENVANLDFATMAGVRGFRINKVLLNSPAESTYNLVCNTTTGSFSLGDEQLTAVFIPDPDAFGRLVAITP